MDTAELERVSAALVAACSPEEVFGPQAGTEAEMFEGARKVFRQMARVVHPDLYQGSAHFEEAGRAFKKLQQLWELAQVRIEAGTYGVEDVSTVFKPFSIRTEKQQYTVERFVTRGDLCALYAGTSLLAPDKRRVLKVPMKPADNDLVANEARILTRLRDADGYEKLRHFVSQLVDTFSYQEEATGAVRQVNVLAYVEGLVALTEVKEAYPRGVDPRHVAWMWRRLLVALGFAHANGVIHGAVLPPHVLIQPEEHGVVLVDWSYAVLDPVESGERISAICADYRAWYPSEVFAREVPTPGLDILMAARCMIDLLGGDPVQRTMPESVPWQLQSYFKACTLPNPRQRPQDAHSLLKQFDELIERLWGARKFCQFVMPKR